VEIARVCTTVNCKKKRLEEEISTEIEHKMKE
jgi:hypothetical protein